MTSVGSPSSFSASTPVTRTNSGLTYVRWQSPVVPDDGIRRVFRKRAKGPFAVAQCHFGRSQSGDVAPNAEHADDLAFGVLLRNVSHLENAHALGGLPTRLSCLFGCPSTNARLTACSRRSVLLRVGGGAKLAWGLPMKASCGSAERLGNGGVGVEIPAVAVEAGNEVREIFGQGAKELLASLQFVDVATDGEHAGNLTVGRELRDDPHMPPADLAFAIA
jgi:hypothetical protein